MLVLEIVASINATKKDRCSYPTGGGDIHKKPIEQPTQTPITSYTEEIMTAQFECQGNLCTTNRTSTRVVGE